jgi:lantibiotic modifying enzyme
MFLSQTTYQPSLALQQIAFKACSLSDKLSLSPMLIQDLNYDIARQRLQKWQKIVSKNDSVKFRHRLSWAGLNEEEVLKALADGNPTDEYKVPNSDWLICLQLVLDIAKNYSPKSAKENSQHQCFNLDSPIPFEAVYLPFILVAEKQLSFLNCIAPQAANQLIRSLLENLARIGAPTLMAEFEAFRRNSNSFRDFLLMHSTQISSTCKTTLSSSNFLG